MLIPLPFAVQLVNLEWVQEESEYLPMFAMHAFFSPEGGTGSVGGRGEMGAWEGVTVLGAWAVIPLASGPSSYGAGTPGAQS